MPLTPPPLVELQEAFTGILTNLEQIGSGGQAVVYRGVRLRNAVGVETGDDITLKIYFDPAQDERVAREIQTAQEVSSDCLCALLSHGYVTIAASKYRYLIWSYIIGEPLDAFLKRANARPELVYVLGRDVAKAIQAIWEKRIVHRDVNPKNIMLAKGFERAVLIDLGVAKFLDQTPLTAAGLTWGTAGYLSPEQMMGVPLTCQSDVFSLGITLQEALCSRHPTNQDQQSLLNGGVPTHTVAPDAPASLAILIDRMLLLRPARRPSPRELIDTFSLLNAGR